LFARGLRTTSERKARLRRTPRLAIQTLEDRLVPTAFYFDSPSTVSRPEGYPTSAGPVTLSVRIDASPATAVSVQYQTADGSATAGSDVSLPKMLAA
jgi:hypothetical protein